MSISAESKLVIYADDILLGLLGKHLHDYQLLQQDVEALGK